MVQPPAWPEEAVAAECVCWGWREGGSVEQSKAHPVKFFRRKPRPREGHRSVWNHVTGPQRAWGHSGPAPPHIPAAGCRFGEAERTGQGGRRASLRQVALLKLGLVASPTSFPWKQPVGQLVPVTLRPGGASAPDRLQELASSRGGGGARSPAGVPLLPTFCCRSLV